MPTITGRRINAPARAATRVASTVNPSARGQVPPPQRGTVTPVTPEPCCCPACTTLQCLDRTRFFAGQLLTEADLNNEQSYWLAKSRLHNRFLHGWGVVCGLQVVCSECDGWVTVKTGYAIDPCGNDVIVCQETPFNVLKAIQACCTPAKQTNCSPLRYTPPPTCQDVIQTWCITIEYQEQESRLVTPLQPPSKTCSCGCGGTSKGGCGCGCGGSGASNGNGSSKSTCCSSTQTAVAATVPAGACEPTRIIEGFKLGLICEPQPTTTTTKRLPAPAPGTFGYQFELCFQTLQSLLLQKPTFVVGQTTPLQAYQAACNYLTAVRNALSASYLTHCQIESKIDVVSIPSPPLQDPNGTYLSGLQATVDMIALLIRATALDCMCSSLLPPCPPDPCDDRLILACVTVQNGKIINICHFGGRKQVVTFPSLYYWLSIFRFDVLLADLIKLLEVICCGEEGGRLPILAGEVNYRENITSAGFTNPGSLNRSVMAFVAQRIGANLLNSAMPNLNAVDLRPLVGLDMETATRTLTTQYHIPEGNITPTSVDADPAWTDSAVASAAQYAPAAFNPGDNLTMYTKGKQVVGFEATSPTELLKAQVQRLQQQVDQLTGGTEPPAGTVGESGPPPRKKR